MLDLDVNSFIGTYGEAIAWIGGGFIVASILVGMYKAWRVFSKVRDKIL